MTFIDLNKAYDKVPRGFFVVMSKKDVQGKHIGLVKYMSRCVEE